MFMTYLVHMQQKGEGCDYGYWSSSGCGHRVKIYKADSPQGVIEQITSQLEEDEELEYFKESIKSIKIYEIIDTHEVNVENLGTLFSGQ